MTIWTNIRKINIKKNKNKYVLLKGILYSVFTYTYWNLAIKTTLSLSLSLSLLFIYITLDADFDFLSGKKYAYWSRLINKNCFFVRNELKVMKPNWTDENSQILLLSLIERNELNYQQGWRINLEHNLLMKTLFVQIHGQSST